MAIQLSDVTDFVGVTSARKNRSQRPTNDKYDPEQAGHRKVLLKWEAATRAPLSTDKDASKKNRTVLIIGIVIALLLVAMGEFLLIAVVASYIFIKNILSSTPPRTVEHVLSTHGIDYSGEFFGWEELKSFYFSSADGLDILCVDTLSRLPGRLFLTLQAGSKEKVKEIVNEYLTFIPVEPKSAIDKLYNAASSKINLG